MAVSIPRSKSRSATCRSESDRVNVTDIWFPSAGGDDMISRGGHIVADDQQVI